MVRIPAFCDSGQRKCLMKPFGSSRAFFQTIVIQSAQHLDRWRSWQNQDQDQDQTDEWASVKGPGKNQGGLHLAFFLTRTLKEVMHKSMKSNHCQGCWVQVGVLCLRHQRGNLPHQNTHPLFHPSKRAVDDLICSCDSRAEPELYWVDAVERTSGWKVDFRFNRMFMIQLILLFMMLFVFIIREVTGQTSGCQLEASQLWVVHQTDLLTYWFE